MFPLMPCLANPRHERFVRRYLKSANATEAYREAGFKTTKQRCIEVSGSRLLKNVEVQRRFAELRRSMAQKTEISLVSLLNDLAEDRRQAKALGQMAPAIQATQLAAKLTGHLVDRKETGSPGDFAGLKSAGEVLDVIRRELGDAAAAAIEAALAAPQEAEEANQLPDLAEVSTDQAPN